MVRATFSKKFYLILPSAAFVLAFFLYFQFYIPDPSISNLNTILSQLKNVKTLKAARGLGPLIRNAFIEELTNEDCDFTALENLEFTEKVISRIKYKEEELALVKTLLSELLRRKRNKRGIVLYCLDTIMQGLNPDATKDSVFILNKKAADFNKKVIQINDPSELQRTYFKLGETYLKLGQLPEAEKAFFKFWEINPENKLTYNVRFILSWINKLEKKFDTAKTILEALIDAAPIMKISLASRFQLADIYEKNTKFEEGIGLYESISEESTDWFVSGLSLLEAGYVYLENLNKPGEAIKEFREIEVRWPESTLAKYLNRNMKLILAKNYCQLGYAYLLQNKFSQAIEYFSRALEINSNDGSSYAGKGIAHLELGNKEKALELARLAKESVPKSNVAISNVGYIYLRLGMPEEAITEYKNYLTVNPFSKDIHYNLGYIYAIKGQLEDALYEFRRAAEISPRFSLAYNNAGYVLWSMGKYADAMLEFKKALQADPDLLVAHFNLGVIYKILGRIEESDAEFEILNKIDSDYAQKIKGFQ